MYHVVVFEKLVEGSFAETLHRHVPDQHLCNPAALVWAFGLPPLPVTRFELSSTWREAGSNAGFQVRGPHSLDGEVFRLKDDVILDGRESYPEDCYRRIGKIRIMQAGEKIHDRDPVNERDFFNKSVL